MLLNHVSKRGPYRTNYMCLVNSSSDQYSTFVKLRFTWDRCVATMPYAVNWKIRFQQHRRNAKPSKIPYFLDKPTTYGTIDTKPELPKVISCYLTTPSHNLNPFWLIVHWTSMDTCQCVIKINSNFLVYENISGVSSCKRGLFSSGLNVFI